MVILALRQHRGHGFWVALALAALWIFVGWSFLWNRYMPINWAMAYVAPVFGVEALLLAIAAARGGDVFERSDVTARLGLLIAAVGLVAYPLLAPLFGRPWSQAEVFGIAPDPTAIATLGLMLSARGRWPLLLLPIPIAWLLLSGLTLQTMGDPQGWIAFGVAGTAGHLRSGVLWLDDDRPRSLGRHPQHEDGGRFAARQRAFASATTGDQALASFSASASCSPVICAEIVSRCLAAFA